MSPIPASELEKLHVVYLGPPEDSAIWERLGNESKFVILSGAEGTGRRATALHNLSRLGLTTLIELSPDSVLSELEAQDIPERVGLFADCLSVGMLAGLERFSLDRVRRNLRGKQSALIVATTAMPSQLPDACADHIIEFVGLGGLEKPLDWRRDLLCRHLRWYHGADENARNAQEQLLADKRIRELLSEALQPRELDKLAQSLVPVLCSDAELDAVLATFEHRARQQVERWFAEDRPLSESLLLISAAVFNGASYSDVVAASRSLEQLVVPPEKNLAKPSKPAPSLKKGRTSRLLTIGAHTERGEATGEYGQVPVETLVLDNPSWQPEVLRYLVTEDLLREELVSWLSAYGNHPNGGLRRRAAAALGAIAGYDFPFVLNTVLRSWARSRDPHERLAAGVALGVAAWKDELSPAVLALLHHWTTVDNWRLRWTAAATYGGLVGERYPLRALDDLCHIAKQDDLRLVGPVIHSLGTLYDLGESMPEYSHWALEALDQWTRSRRSPEYIVGLFAFTELAWPRRDRGQDMRWARLLRYAQGDDEMLNLTANLLGRALNYKPIRRDALAVVRGWIERADQEEITEPAIESILKRVASAGKRDAERLRYHLAMWAMDRSNPLPLAAQFSLD